MSLVTVRYLCGNPRCGHVSTARVRSGERVRERHRTRCGSCRKRTWHYRWCRWPITGRGNPRKRRRA